MVCKPGLRKSRADWERAGRCRRRHWACINFPIFILSSSEWMFGHDCGYKRHKGFCSEKEKEMSIAQTPAVQSGNTPQCPWTLRVPSFTKDVFPQRDELQTFCTSSCFVFWLPERWEDIKFASCNGTIKWILWQPGSHLCDATVGHWKEL